MSHNPNKGHLILTEMTDEVTPEEMAILNSDTFYNQTVYDTDFLTEEAVREENREGREQGAKRFFLLDGTEAVGILEYLQDYPSEGCMWIGLLQIRKIDQGKGYGRLALELLYELMHDKRKTAIRLGVITGNDPAHRFWRSNGFVYIRTVPYGENKEVALYEKTLIS